ncbi:SGNH/GDSL hydrolase family protein [Streptomyces sp. NPDC005962]|uniref:SGNH/GDSL hydrolase family protein n=1 Tax=Streptomyces sp. NPDC005962 TaxID=3154466 RepID=UPI0033FA5683
MPTIRLTVLGDSFVEGRGDPAPGDGFRGWVSRFAGGLHLPRKTVLNLGVHGATTQAVVDGQLRRALVNKAPLTGVIVGVNDLIGDYDRLRFRRNLHTIFSSLAGADTTVLTASYPDIPGNLPLPDRFRAQMRERFAEANAALYDITRATGTLCLDIGRLPEWRNPAFWSEDGLHPSPLGHQRFADSMAELFSRTTGMTGLNAA